ncbi:MAG: hypothetical protein HQ500_12250 [Flavobacteriales bacterium]|nr:hypothetical protein [Flavobacteriales bacterium]
MENSGEFGLVNISQDTYYLLKGNPVLAFEFRGNIEAKGKSEMQMYYVNYPNFIHKLLELIHLQPAS